ncbi:MAG: ribose-phosphate pyrophosphokinase [Candidatus Rokubacteria bacterium]|nr:ribose-phosphate pyrophosphokinase [Candidatus Rokubacteria bacterium]
MILFALSPHASLAQALHDLTGVERGRCAVSRFSNQELYATLETDPAGRACLVLGAVAPPDEHLLATLLLVHTLKKEGARTVTVLLPYLGYARHDKAEPRRSRATAWLGALLHASGADDVVAVDVHSSLVHQLFPIPVRSLSPAELFARELATLPLAEPAIVAPDAGALERCDAVRRAAGIRRPLAHFTKERTPEGIKHSVLHGAVGRQAVLVDDILDTGGTLVSACEGLRRAGVEEIVVMATHGLFTGRAWERLWSLGVTRIYCTDTTPPPGHLGSAAVVVLSVAPLLAGCLKPATKDGEP